MIVALCYTSYSFGKSQVKMVKIPIGIRVLDGDGRPIRPDSGVKLQLFKFGGSSWPRDRWADINGRPDEDGYLYTTTDFPLDPQVTQRMYEESKKP
jgi:hypothetical protein